MDAVVPAAFNADADSAGSLGPGVPARSAMRRHVLAAKSARPDRITIFALPSGHRFFTTHWKSGRSDTTTLSRGTSP
jgi:hypothetical protein